MAGEATLYCDDCGPTDLRTKVGVGVQPMEHKDLETLAPDKAGNHLHSTFSGLALPPGQGTVVWSAALRPDSVGADLALERHA